MNFYRDWKLYDELPLGWVIDKTAGSPLHGYEFCTNGKSVLNGQKRALVKIKGVQLVENPTVRKIQTVVAKNETSDINYTFPAKTVNDLARKKFQEQLLKEIMVDIMICDIEGWDKLEYLNELKNLINSFKIKVKTNGVSFPPQLSLFD